MTTSCAYLDKYDCDEAINGSLIFVKPNTPYYSCTELFSPLFDGSEKSYLASTVNLIVMDSESGHRGIVTLISEYGLRK